MPERAVGRWRDELDALPNEFVGALIDFRRRDLEGELKRGAAGRRWWVLGRQARPGECQRIAADLVFEPTGRQFPRQREAQHALVEAAHRCHVAHEDDRVVDRADPFETRAAHDQVVRRAGRQL